jgi:hypothetical protein
MDVFVSNIMHIEENYAAILEKKDETLADHVARMGQVLQEADYAEREFRRLSEPNAERIGREVV